MNIVVAYDGSESATRALGKAAELAGRNGAAVTVVSVVSVHQSGVHGSLPIDPGEPSERQTQLSEAKALLERSGINARLVEGRGDPATVVLEEARASGADLAVVGTRGQNAMARGLLGSVSTKILHDAPCDVLVVR